MAVASPNLPPARSAKCHDNQAKLPKTQRIAASPSPLRAWRFFTSSAHPREAETDSFLAWASKTKQRLAAARTRPRAPSLTSTIVVVSRVLARSYVILIGKTLKIRNTWFPGRTQVYMFPPNRIEFISIHKKYSVNRSNSKVSFVNMVRALRNDRNINRYYYDMIRTAVRCSVCVTDET